MTDNSARLMPRLVVRGARQAVDFYQRALDVEVASRFDMPDGSIAYVELAAPGIRFNLKDEDDVDPSPQKLGGTPVLLSLDVPDADAAGAKLEAAGAEVVFAIGDSDYGRRDGRFRDPFGHQWLVSQVISARNE